MIVLVTALFTVKWSGAQGSASGRDADIFVSMLGDGYKLVAKAGKNGQLPGNRLDALYDTHRIAPK